MSACTTVVVPAEKAECIDKIFEGMVKVDGLLAMSRDGIRDGIALRHVFKRDTMEAQEFCLAAGVLVGGGGWRELWSKAGSKASSGPTRRPMCQSFRRTFCSSREGSVRKSLRR